MTKLAIFDVDGTLVDSRAVLKSASDAAFIAIGVEPPPYEEMRKIIGLSLLEGLAQLAPYLTLGQLEQLQEHYKLSFRELHRDPDFIEPLYDGAAELLDRLKGDGWQIAMATGKSRRGVETIIEMHGWADLFDTTHCADDGPGKPHPAMLHAAMDVMGARPQDTVMIGDTSFDMLMAKAAGMHAVGVTWGFHTRAEIEAGGPDLMVETFPDLTAELLRFGAVVG